ncbi:hypothetical protein HNS20_27775, partial [Escherichia coli]
WKGWAIFLRQKQKKLIMLPSEIMIWQPEFTDKILSRKPGAVQPFVINTYKPEDQLFVSGIHKEGYIQVCAALNGIVKIIKAQSFCVFFVKEVIVVKLHDIAGKFAS